MPLLRGVFLLVTVFLGILLFTILQKTGLPYNEDLLTEVQVGTLIFTIMNLGLSIPLVGYGVVDIARRDKFPRSWLSSARKVKRGLAINERNFGEDKAGN